MNGAAMNCRQDPGLRPQHRDSSSLHNPGYHLQINRQQNLQPQNSKTLNYPSFSTNYRVDGYCDNLHKYENIVDSRHSNREVEDPRFQRPRAARRRIEPIDLPVPQFEIDEHTVSDQLNPNDAVVEGSKGLDLDTRIGLLIKSKALAGMHPIFSDLNESEDSESDLDDPFLSRPISKFKKERRKIPIAGEVMDIPIRESFDDPEKPLSRPPSPFLSRATYLFWFNKAIEIKQQAKAQEQALLEQAAKRLIQDSSPSLKINQPDKPPKKPILKNLMDEISKELKEVIKQEFIREVIEQTAFNTLDDWWEKQNKEEKRDKTENLKLTKNKSNENCRDSLICCSEFKGSTSPKLPFSRKKDIKHKKECKKEDDMKFTFHDEISVNEALRENFENSLDCKNSVPRDKDMTSSDSSIEKPEEPRAKEISGEDLKKICEINCLEVSSLVKCISGKIDNSVNKEHSEGANGFSKVTSRSNSCESEVLAKKSESIELLPPKLGTSVDGNIDDKFVIVKDILDILFYEMNEIVLQRNDIPQQVLNENQACKIRSDVVNSISSVLPSDKFADINL